MEIASQGIKQQKKSANNSKNVDAGIPDNIDALTFFSPRICDEIKLAYPIICNCEMDIIDKLIQVVIRYMQVGDSFILPSKVYSLDEKYDHKDINLLLISIYLIIKQAIRTKVKLSCIRNDLTTMKMPSYFINGICEAISISRNIIENKVSLYRVHYLQLTKLRWRIDVVISSGVLSKVLRPTILMQMLFSSGRVTTFEVSLEQFHQLRYSVAKVLNDMQKLERHPIIKIINEFKKREEDDYNN